MNQIGFEEDRMISEARKNTSTSAGPRRKSIAVDVGGVMVGGAAPLDGNFHCIGHQPLGVNSISCSAITRRSGR